MNFQSLIRVQISTKKAIDFHSLSHKTNAFLKKSKDVLESKDFLYNPCTRELKLHLHSAA